MDGRRLLPSSSRIRGVISLNPSSMIAKTNGEEGRQEDGNDLR